MGIKNWLFGKDGQSSKKVDKEAEAISKLKKQLNSLEVEGRNLFRKSEEQKTVAKTMIRSGNKVGAKQALTRSSLYLQKYNQIQNMSLNLSTQVDTISTAKSTAETVEALQIGSKVVESTLAQVDPMDVERTMAELEDQRDRIGLMTESLSDVTGLEMDLDGEMVDGIDEQLAALELEMQSESHGDLPSTTTMTTTGIEEKETEKNNEDMTDLEKELKNLAKELGESD